jgi:hypothetical protein
LGRVRNNSCVGTTTWLGSSSKKKNTELVNLNRDLNVAVFLH